MLRSPILWRGTVLGVLLLARVVLRSAIRHVLHMTWLLVDESLLLALPRLHLLILLRQVTGTAAARHEAVLAAVAFETVLLPDLAALHHLNYPLQCAAAKSAVANTL